MIFFGTSDNIRFEINGIPTRVRSLADEHGSFFAIEATDSSLSDICGDIVLGKFIKKIVNMKYQGNVVVIKAYY